MVLGALAAVFGWLVRPITIRLDLAEPVIAAWTVVVVFLLAAGVGYVAWRTWRVLQHRRRGHVPGGSSRWSRTRRSTG